MTKGKQVTPAASQPPVAPEPLTEAPKPPLDTFGLELALARLNDLKRARANAQEPEYVALTRTIAALIQAAGRVE